MPLLFAITLFVSATLLFLVEPMVAKMVLPLLGGTPAVWNTCMVFFQGALLAGYAYAHATTAWLGTRRQVLLHVVLMALPLLVLPIGLRGWVPPPDANPIPSLLLLLVLSVGLPFFVLSASAPLLQKWFAATDHPSAKDPYFLYAASNVGSMLAIFAYPALVEPNLHLKAEKWFAFDTQSGLWALGYGVLVVLMLVCAWVVWEKPKNGIAQAKRRLEQNTVAGEDEALSTSPPSLVTRLRWLALAFVPSSMMLGVTTYITLDIAAIPLLWVIPLGLYLLSFILVFARLPAVMHKIVILAAPLAILLLVFVKVAEPKGVVLKICVHLLALFMVSMLCHGELARTRPSTRYLTGFYLLMSVGGVLGGLFNALIAPLVFNDLYEYPLAIVMACMLVPAFGAGGENSFTGWTLKRFARRGEESKIGAFSGRLLSFLKFGERGWQGWATGLLIDFGMALLLGGIVVAFVTFFRDDNQDAAWLKSLPSWLASFRDWISKRIDKATANGRFNEAQLRAILMYGIPILICYAFVTRPIRFGLGVAALFVASACATSSVGPIPGQHNWFARFLQVFHYERSASDSDAWQVLHRERSFFGVLTVEYYKPSKRYRLMHGTTTHGEQIRGDDMEFTPLTYYHETGPIGQVFASMKDRLKDKHLAFIGLGSGTLACYGKPGQHVDFYDIDRAVVRISTELGYFTYYQNCKADKQVILGDARLKMEEADTGKYQLIVVDAFSSDAIPVHLITREAIELYFAKMKPDGVLAVHISNRYLDLEPVLGNLAEKLNLATLREYDFETTGDPFPPGKYSSDWVILARRPQDFGSLGTDERWRPTKTNPLVGVWTDDFSNLLRVFEWKN